MLFYSNGIGLLIKKLNGLSICNEELYITVLGWGMMIKILFNIIYSNHYWKLKARVRGKAAKRAVLLICLLALTVTGTGMPVAMAGKNDAVDFPDANMQLALLESGADADGDGALTRGELAEFSGTLDLSGRSISDISGLETAVNVTELNLSGNAISDISILAALDKLTVINLSDNHIFDISTLYNTGNPPETFALQKLDISGNYLSTADGSSAREVIDALRTAGVALTFDPQKPIPAMDVALNAEAFDMCPGDTATLSAVVSPEGAVNQNVTWQTSEPAVAGVENGVITALSAGQAVITVTAEDGGWTDTCVVDVKSGTLTSDVYTVDGKLIYVAPLTAEERLRENLSNNTDDVSIWDTDSGEVSGKNLVTGMTVKLTVGGIERDARTVVVKGDLNGDGLVSIRDYTLLNLHLQGLKTLDTIYAIAADYDGDLRLSDADAEGMRLAFSGVDSSGEGLSALPDVADPQLQAFLDTALAQLGKPYVWGAEGPNGFDCSGFVYYCLRQAGYDVDRATADMYSRFKKWKYVDKDDLQPGDLMFYYSDDKGDGDHIGHIGIYIGNGYHIHASSDYGCIIICGVQGWYKSALAFGRRVFE